jgi:hypothetical protein
LRGADRRCERGDARRAASRPPMPRSEARMKSKSRRGQQVGSPRPCCPVSGPDERRGILGSSSGRSSGLSPDEDRRSRSSSVRSSSGSPFGTCCPVPSGGLADLSAVRPPREAIECLKQAFSNEERLTRELAETRDTIQRCLNESRRSGATWTAVARALITPRGTHAEQIKQIHRTAGRLACRHWQRRSRQG